MSKIKFISTWTLIFGTLILFTAFALLTFISPDTEKIYAQTIASDPRLSQSRHFVVLEDGIDIDGPPPGEGRHKRMSGFYQNDRICSISQSQFERLEERYGAKKTDMYLHGVTHRVDFVVVKRKDNPDIHARDIKEFLREDGGDYRCMVVPRRDGFFMLFRGDVS